MSINTVFLQLTADERQELGDRIARGEVVADTEAKADAFDMVLRSGRNVRGFYRWGTEYGEFDMFEVVG